jgi:hypothetical protein
MSNRTGLLFILMLSLFGFREFHIVHAVQGEEDLLIDADEEWQEVSSYHCGNTYLSQFEKSRNFQIKGTVDGVLVYYAYYTPEDIMVIEKSVEGKWSKHRVEAKDAYVDGVKSISLHSGLDSGAISMCIAKIRTLQTLGTLLSVEDKTVR